MPTAAKAQKPERAGSREEMPAPCTCMGQMGAHVHACMGRTLEHAVRVTEREGEEVDAISIH